VTTGDRPVIGDLGAGRRARSGRRRLAAGPAGPSPSPPTAEARSAWARERGARRVPLGDGPRVDRCGGRRRGRRGAGPHGTPSPACPSRCSNRKPERASMPNAHDGASRTHGKCLFMDSRHSVDRFCTSNWLTMLLTGVSCFPKAKGTRGEDAELSGDRENGAGRSWLKSLTRAVTPLPTKMRVGRRRASCARRRAQPGECTTPCTHRAAGRALAPGSAGRRARGSAGRTAAHSPRAAPA
jgi:hypothetical protein